MQLSSGSGVHIQDLKFIINAVQNGRFIFFFILMISVTSPLLCQTLV